jgi:tetratricopeptide (TPR) repeat protein
MHIFSARFLFRSFILFFTCLLLNCTTHYSSALSHFNKGNVAYKNGQLGRSIKEYNESLNVLNQAQAHPSVLLLRASIYHQIHLMNPVVFWDNLDDSIKDKCPIIKNIMSARSLNASFPFLAQAYDSLFNPDFIPDDFSTAPEYKWLSISRDVIIGDVLVQYSVDTIPFASFNTDSFLSQMHYYIYHELALNFYLNSWKKSSLLLDQKINFDLTRLLNLSHLRIKETLWILASSSVSLSQMKENENFRIFFQKRYRLYMDLLEQFDKSMVISASDLDISVNSTSKLSGFSPDISFMSLDFFSSFKASQKEFSSFIDLLVSSKPPSFSILFTSLKYLCLSRFLSSRFSSLYTDALFFLAQDIYFNLSLLLN